MSEDAQEQSGTSRAPVNGGEKSSSDPVLVLPRASVPTDKVYLWRSYEKDRQDVNGNKIDCIHSRCPEFVIYFCREGGRKDGCPDLYYDCTDELLATTALPNAALAKVNRLITEEPNERKTTLEFVGDAFEMWLCKQYTESKKILDDIVAEMEGARETKGRLFYQSAALVTTLLVWFLFFVHQSQTVYTAYPGVGPWLLAAALGATGGFFSVCLNLGSVKVNVSQSLKFLSFAGATRAGIAVLAAIACLLAVQGKIILGLATGGDATDFTDLNSIPKPVLFFLFLAGFSETFIPNILRDSEKDASVTKKSNEKVEIDASSGAVRRQFSVESKTE